MTKIAAAAFLLIGCVNTDNIIGQCKSAAQQAENGAWDRCTAFYEDEVIPEVKAAAQTLESDLLQNLGCVRKGTGWDCSGLCAPPSSTPPPPSLPWRCANGICVPVDPGSVWTSSDHDSGR